MESKKFMGHPVGLFVLFFTELWERFSFYGMKAILVLYMVASIEKGGLGWSNAKGLEIYGWYNMLVYVMAIPGGIIADRYLGQRKSVYLGGLLLCAGHLLLAYPPEAAFFSALGLIVLGVGLLKPNISTMVGELYPDGDAAKDAGFTIFYMGINIGAFFSGIAVGWLAYKYGWHYGFGLAGIGMIIGQIVYAYGQKYLGTAGLKKNVCIDAATSRPVKCEFTAVEKRKIGLVIFSFLIVIVFWAAFEQAGGLMSLYTEQFTSRDLFGFTIPTAWFQSLNPFYIMIFAPVVASFWIMLSRIGKEPSALTKMGLGTMILGIGFLFMVGASVERGGDELAKSSMLWLCLAYFFHTIGELALSPVSLSFITNMAPKRMTSQVMGWYFAVTGIAGYFASKIGIFAETAGELKVFGLIAGFTMFFGILLMIIAPKINKIADIHRTDG
ncbi:MAG TPA: peptide MFS transporter [bacterium]|nr:peptide MFS transporter [bacterium]HQJ60046.1 peptide MFS transporter [bacterium]